MQTKAACINTFYHEIYSCDGKVKYSANLLHVIMSSTFQRGFDIVNPLKQNKTLFVMYKVTETDAISVKCIR